MDFNKDFLSALQTNITLTKATFIQDYLPKPLSPPIFVSDNLSFVQAYGLVHAVYPYYYEIIGLDSHCLIYTESGAGTLILKDKNHSLIPNTIAFVDCRESHRIEIRQSSWNYIVFYLKGDALSFLYDTLTKGSENIYHFSCCSVIPSLIRRFYTLLEQNPENYFLHTRIINDILLDLINEKIRKGEGESVPNYLIKTQQNFDLNYHESFSLDLLEQQYHISKYRLCREFTKQFGTSPIQYLNHRRIEAAKDALQAGDKRINEIGRMVGFESTNHFIRLFKQQTGVTPLIFRKQHRLN